MALGGAAGLLGCPLSDPAFSEVSPRGARARQAGFTGALLIAPAAGTGEAFAVTGCFYRLYFQSGGPGGWLGLPVSDAVNTPDGQKQRFEGGVIRAYRALATCEAEPAPRG
jgi:uncharacterized protein with LGFP repeats